MSNTQAKRPEGRCWPWSHRWSVWAPDWQMSGFRSNFDRRECLRCGRTKRKYR